MPIASAVTFTPNVPATVTPTAAPLPAGLTYQTDCEIYYGVAPDSPRDQALDGRYGNGPQVPSPNGEYVAFRSYTVNGSQAIHAIHVESTSGAPAVQVPVQGLPGLSFLTNPIWSADGQYIAFTAGSLSEPGGGRVYSLKLGSNELRSVAEYMGYHDLIAWSPAGTQIAYTSGPVSPESLTHVWPYQIYVADRDGHGQPQRVADGCDPVWQLNPPPGG